MVFREKIFESVVFERLFFTSESGGLLSSGIRARVWQVGTVSEYPKDNIILAGTYPCSDTKTVTPSPGYHLTVALRTRAWKTNVRKRHFQKSFLGKPFIGFKQISYSGNFLNLKYIFVIFKKTNQSQLGFINQFQNQIPDFLKIIAEDVNLK